MVVRTARSFSSRAAIFALIYWQAEMPERNPPALLRGHGGRQERAGKEGALLFPCSGRRGIEREGDREVGGRARGPGKACGKKANGGRRAAGCSHARRGEARATAVLRRAKGKGQRPDLRSPAPPHAVEGASGARKGGDLECHRGPRKQPLGAFSGPPRRTAPAAKSEAGARGCLRKPFS